MVQELRTKIEHYFKLVVRATRDNIPKLIGYFLVKGCQVFINPHTLGLNVEIIIIKFNAKSNHPLCNK